MRSDKAIRAFRVLYVFSPLSISFRRIAVMSSLGEDTGLFARLRQRGEQTLARARDLLRTSEWRIAAENRTSGDTVQSVTVPGIGKIFLLTAVFNSSSERVWTALCGDIERLPNWCRVFAAARVLTTVDSQTDVLYHETHAAGGGIVAPRDWITLRHWERERDWFQQAAVGVDFPLTEHKKSMVRGETVISLYSVNLMTPEGQVTPGTPTDGERCRLQFMSCCNVGGWLPTKLVEHFYVSSCLKLASDLRQHLEK